MKTCLITIITLVLATTTWAIDCTAPDSYGLYFDTNADMACADGLAPYDQLEMHLILTNPSQPTMLGYDAGLDITGEALVLSTQPYWPNTMEEIFWDNYFQVYLEPRPTAPATLLLTYQVIYLASDFSPVEFFLRGTNFSPIDQALPLIIWEENVYQNAILSAPFGAVAQINGDCGVVATTGLSFDGVKSLYR